MLEEVPVLIDMIHGRNVALLKGPHGREYFGIACSHAEADELGFTLLKALDYYDKYEQRIHDLVHREPQAFSSGHVTSKDNEMLRENIVNQLSHLKLADVKQMTGYEQTHHQLLIDTLESILEGKPYTMRLKF